MEVSTLIDAYFDVNILLAVSLGLWFVAQRLLVNLGLSRSYTTQLKLLSAVFLATLFSPVLLATIGAIPSTELLSNRFSVNITDMVTAQYLHGSFEMTPSTFEQALGFRTRLMGQIQHLETGLGLAFLGLIGAGFLFSVVRLAIGVTKLRRVVNESNIWRRIGCLELRVSDTISIPFSTRCLRRRIIIIPSAIVADPTDLKVALGHEFQHLRQHDLEWEIGLELLKPFFFWNPAYTIWKRQFEALRELSCDQNVLARNRVDVGEYCHSLLSICEKTLKPNRLFIAEVPRVALLEKRRLFLGKNPAQLLRQRLDSLTDGNQVRHPKALFAILITPLLALTLIGSLAIQKPKGWSHDRLMLSAIVNLERLAVRNSIASVANGTGFGMVSKIQN
ncbi:MAG: biotin transporter BioY [Rhodobacteraceae bacterium]|nr:biotin transporter BioY [Paracoccaceae bacterium]